MSFKGGNFKVILNGEVFMKVELHPIVLRGLIGWTNTGLPFA